MITDKAEMQKLLENAVLEPVAASCDTSLKMRNDGGQGIYYLTANFPDGRACPLYSRGRQVPNRALRRLSQRCAEACGVIRKNRKRLLLFSRRFC